MYKTYDKAIINCQNMVTEARINTAKRFDPDFWRNRAVLFYRFLQSFLHKLCLKLEYIMEIV